LARGTAPAINGFDDTTDDQADCAHGFGEHDYVTASFEEGSRPRVR
jgi:hypothetical protein